MSHFILMDGLAGSPAITFHELIGSLLDAGHIVHTPDVQDIRSHGDRIDEALNASSSLLSRQDKVKGEQIFLLGFSAGGSAIMSAAAYLSRLGIPLGGIILLSTAMPRWFWFMTPTLASKMTPRLLQMLSGQRINLRTKEYLDLVAPIDDRLVEYATQYLQPISGQEARQLAFHPPPFQIWNYPTLMIHGDNDKWVSTRSHRKLGKILSKRMGSLFEEMEVEGSGHHVLFSQRREDVFKKIVDWTRVQDPEPICV